MPPRLADDARFCDYTQHLYFDKQGHFCRRCDRCIRGWGLSQALIFEIDPDHGALGCRQCEFCQKGQFYSEHFSYEECKPCSDCRREGKFEDRPCTPTQNAICGNSLNERLLENNPVFLEEYIYGILGGVLFLMLLVILVVCMVLKRRRNHYAARHADGEESNKGLMGSNTCTHSSTATGSGTSTSECLEMVETDGEYETEQKRNIYNKVKEWKNSHDLYGELTDAHARMISKYIAAGNKFVDIGLQLGLDDNTIKIIKSDYHGDLHTQAYETLIKWKQVKASNATELRLLDALIHLEFYEVAEAFCDKYESYKPGL